MPVTTIKQKNSDYAEYQNKLPKEIKEILEEFNKSDYAKEYNLRWNEKIGGIQDLNADVNDPIAVPMLSSDKSLGWLIHCVQAPKSDFQLKRVRSIINLLESPVNTSVE